MLNCRGHLSAQALHALCLTDVELCLPPDDRARFARALAPYLKARCPAARPLRRLLVGSRLPRLDKGLAVVGSAAQAQAISAQRSTSGMRHTVRQMQKRLGVPC